MSKNNTFENLLKAFTYCREIIDKDLFYQWDEDEPSQRQSYMWRLEDELSVGELDHNALGNNMDDSVEDVVAYLDSYSGENENIRRDITDYLLKLYLVIERVYEVMNIMGLTKGHHPKDGQIPLDYKQATDGMKAMREIKQWANFIKHPNAFLWCHEPEYFCESLGNASPEYENSFIVNQDTVNKYYKLDQKKHRELYGMIANKDMVCVIFPEIGLLTERFCQGVKDFCDTATSPLYKSILKDRSTYENYFEYLDEDEDNICDPKE